MTTTASWPSSGSPHSTLEAAEDEHLHVRASPSSSAVLPPPPRLPYDLSYPPLSPLGVDQTGHSLALQYPEQAQAQAARAAASTASSVAPAGAAASSSLSSTVQNGGPNDGADTSTKGNKPTAPTAHTSTNTSSRHAPTEKPKKILPGQELEQHLLSETPGQRPMPWGLQLTLNEKAAVAVQNGNGVSQPNRTRMGTQKRNASRESRLRTAGGKAVIHSDSPAPLARLLTADDDTASEFEASPQLPSLEVQIDEKGSSRILTPPEEKVSAIEEDSSLHSYVPMTTSDADVANVDEVASSVTDAPPPRTEAAPLTTPPEEEQDGENEVGRIPSQPEPNTSLAGTSPAKAASRSRSQQRRGRVSQGADSAHDISAMEEGDESVDSNGSSRRPRAAHKRLKLMGGYYGRNAKPVDAEASTAEQPTVKLEEELNGGEPNGRASRGASSATEERQTRVASGRTGRPSSFGGPTTPVKQPHQPTLSIGLRNSASKVQSSKLVLASSDADGGVGVGGSSVIDNTDGNNEYCETCLGVGHFICCDGCPRSFHFACINPPMDIDELPSMTGDAGDEWYCNACKAQSREKPIGKAVKKRSVFGPLLQYIDDENPSIFSLPQDIRNYFKGVATASDGSYIDSTMLRPLKINKFGLVDERDPLRLKDRNGKLVLCYHCGQSALPVESDAPKSKAPPRRSSPRKSQSKDNLTAGSASGSAAEDAKRAGWRKLIGCDFCSLHWHLDCLDPPLATMPSLSRKWMCPNHVDHVVRPVRVPKNVANSTSIHDLPVPSGRSVGPGKHYRLRVVNDGQIDIIPDPMDTYFGVSSGSSAGRPSTSAHANNQDKKDDTSSSSRSAAALSASVSGAAENRGRGLDKGWEEQDIPTNGSGSKSSHAQNFKFKYRLPEKVIRLDFWSRAALERERSLARLVQLQENQARSRMDVLALTADAAAAAAVNDDERAPRNAAMSDEDAKALVEQVFGAQAARPLFPALGVVQSDDDDDEAMSAPASPSSTLRDPDGSGWLESAVRQTYEAGVYEREAEAHATAIISPAHTQPAAKPVTWTPAMQDAKETAERQASLNATADEAAASAMQIDVDELKRLRAVKALLDSRGPKDVMEYLLDSRKQE